MPAKRRARSPAPEVASSDDAPAREHLAALAVAIAEGYRKSQRDLPWRKVTDPYAIWVSEVMLQQTRVATVIPYWRRWMERFPSCSALAAAPLDDALAAWSGLGFYGRARNLHRGAREVVARWGGQLPRTAAELLGVPGIGPYTAGAIASIAHGERAALVDGNVARVFARLFALERDLKAPTTQRLLWRYARALVDAAPEHLDIGELNQGLMELGATVCGVGAPRCLACPAAALCRARQAGLQDRLPISRAGTPAAALPLLELHALWAMRQGQLLVARRKPKGLFGGLWELPSAPSAEAIAAALGASLADAPPVATHEQVLSHRRLIVWVHAATAPASLGNVGDPSYDAISYAALDELPSLAISAATAAIYAKYKDAPWSSTPTPSSSSKKGTKRSSRGSAASGTTSRTRTSPKPRRGRPKASTSSSTTKAR